METLTGLALAAVLFWGGQQVLSGETTVGKFMTFFAALVMAYQPLRSLANPNASLQEGLAAAERIFSMIDYRPAIADRPDARPLRVEKGRIELHDVHFAYEPSKSALEGVSIDVPAGRTVALVGPSGAGKSTILNLIPRFYALNSGSIAIDGQDVAAVTLRSLRAAIGLVSQEVPTFNDPVRAQLPSGRQNGNG